MKRLLAVAALAAAACIPEEGPMMEPGSDCLECPGGGGGEDDAVAWTVAGTWGGQGLHVYIQDAAGKSFTIRTNQAGNFYTREPLQFPIAVSIEGAFMPPVQGVGGVGESDSCSLRTPTATAATARAGAGTTRTGPVAAPGPAA